jgi:hypothetical protein
VINTLCDTALVYGYSEQQALIDEDIVKNVLADKIESGLFEIDSPEEEGQQPVVMSNHKNESSKDTKADSETHQFDTEMAKLLFTSLSTDKE